jgi:hypothetical protein
MSAKHKGVGPQSLTANELREGMNVWMTQDLNWSTDYKDACLTEDPDKIAQMRERGELKTILLLVSILLTWKPIAVCLSDTAKSSGYPGRHMINPIIQITPTGRPNHVPL